MMHKESQMKQLKITDFDNVESSQVVQEDFENLFNIYKDKRGNYIYNLNKSLYFDTKNANLPEMTIQHDMYWPLASYKLYQTTHLAWLLMKVNDVSTKDLFKKLRAGSTIKYIKPNFIAEILGAMMDE